MRGPSGYHHGMARFQFTPLDSLDDVAGLRAARFETLTELPELYVELHVARSAVYAIDHQERVGYITVLDGILTELYVGPADRTHADAILREATAALDLQHAWAATFDPIAIAASVAAPRSYEVLGLSFRRLTPISLPSPTPLPEERIAAPDDLDLVIGANHSEIFDNLEDIPIWLKQGWITLFELPGDVVGMGLCTPTGAGTLGCDVGIRVTERHQRRGLGAWIAQRMAARAREQGLVPTAGCAVDNAVSRRTLERAGFVADHRLLQFDLQPHVAD